MPARVADASVLAAWFFDEPHRDAAGALLKGFELYAPDLLVYELANVAWVKSRRMPGRIKEIAEALSDAMAFDISTLPVDAAELLDISRGLGITAYDAAYVEVARRIGCSLVTFDRQLARAALAVGLKVPTR